MRGTRECRLCGAECACPPWRECRVCGQKRPVLADGRFPAHRIRTVRCPGGGQFTQRWDALAKRRLVEQVARGWSA